MNNDVYALAFFGSIAVILYCEYPQNAYLTVKRPPFHLYVEFHVSLSIK